MKYASFCYSPVLNALSFGVREADSKPFDEFVGFGGVLRCFESYALLIEHLNFIVDCVCSSESQKSAFLRVVGENVEGLELVKLQLGVVVE